MAVRARLLLSEDWSQAVRAFGEERAQVERALTKAEDLMSNLWAQEMRDSRSPQRCCGPRIGCAKLEMWLVTRRSYAYDDEIVEGGISLSVISP